MLGQNPRVVVRNVAQRPKRYLRHNKHIPDQHRFVHQSHLIPIMLHARNLREVIHENLGERPGPRGPHDIGERRALASFLRGHELTQVLLGKLDEVLDDGMTRFGHHDELGELDGIRLVGPDAILVVVALHADDDVHLIPVLLRYPVLHRLPSLHIDVRPDAAFFQEDQVPQVIRLHHRVVQAREQVCDHLGEVVDDEGVLVEVGDAFVAELGVDGAPLVAEALGAVRRVLGVVFPALPELAGEGFRVQAVERGAGGWGRASAGWVAREGGREMARCEEAREDDRGEENSPWYGVNSSVSLCI